MKKSVKFGLAAAAVAAAAYPALLACRRKNGTWPLLEGWRYAHRGLHDAAQGIPENSMTAFRRAVENGFGAELDVHLLADGSLAVFHDSDLRRMTGREGKIEDLTAADLAAYRLDGTEETIPLFSEVLALFEAAKLPLIVELKCARGNHNELTRAAVELLDQYSIDYCMESFDPRVLFWLKKNRPEIVRGQLACHYEQVEGGPRPLLGHCLQNLLGNGAAQPDFIAYCWEDRGNLSLRLCRKLYNVHTVYWTVRSEEEMLQAERDGAQVIFEGFTPRT